jgi:elongation factor Ts
LNFIINFTQYLSTQMATISASLVNELRAKTGQGMMECKKMLTETGGDLQAAIDAFRKKGVKTSIAERAATEGRVFAATSADKKTSVAVEINCNTDFTAKSDVVLAVLEKAAHKLLHAPETSLADDAELKSELTTIAQQTGENVVLGRTAVVTGVTGSYLYSTSGKGKIAVLISIAGPHSDEVISHLGMHIAAVRPLAMTRSEVAPEIVAKEKEIAIEQAKASGKPQAIAEKIAEGKMNAFYSERVLLDQDFIKPDSFKGTVAAMLKSKGVTLQKFVRIEVGQV